MAETIEVLRIENDQQQGVFWEGEAAVHEITDATGVDPTDMPTPAADDGLMAAWEAYSRRNPSVRQDDLRFAFADRDQMYAAFTAQARTAEILDAHGFKVSRYRVPRRHAIKGDAQVAFRLDMAERVETVPFLAEKE